MTFSLHINTFQNLKPRREEDLQGGGITHNASDTGHTDTFGQSSIAMCARTMELSGRQGRRQRQRTRARGDTVDIATRAAMHGTFGKAAAAGGSPSLSLLPSRPRCCPVLRPHEFNVIVFLTPRLSVSISRVFSALSVQFARRGGHRTGPRCSNVAMDTYMDIHAESQNKCSSIA